ERRARKLLRFGETETDGGRDLMRAAELTSEPLLRRLYLAHAADDLRHGELFRRRGRELLSALPARSNPGFQADWLAPSGHGWTTFAWTGPMRTCSRSYTYRRRRPPAASPYIATCCRTIRRRTRFSRR